MEEGKYHKQDKGTPQGGVISPLLANVYLHYVLDEWLYQEYKPKLKGYAEIVRYADDFVVLFEIQSEAEKFLDDLKIRLDAYGLKVKDSKTKIIPLSLRYNLKSNETFEFLGFRHYVGKSRNHIPRLKRVTSSKRLRIKLIAVNEWLKTNRNQMKLSLLHKVISQHLVGHYRYYGITDNEKKMWKYYAVVTQLLKKWINRRSQKMSMNWDEYKKYLHSFPLPRPRIYHSIFSKNGYFVESLFGRAVCGSSACTVL